MDNRTAPMDNRTAPMDNRTMRQIDNTVDSLAPPTGDAVPATKQRLFGRTKGVHQMLGGGKSANVLLWREWKTSAAIFIVATGLWILFEWSGYTLLTLVANGLLILVAAVFVWAQAAAFLNRAPPPLPSLELSEDTVLWLGQVIRAEVNKALAFGHSVALGKDYKLFAEVVVGLYLLSTVGAWASFLSLTFFGVILAFTVPVFYEKYEDQVDSYLKMGLDKFHEFYRIAEGKVKELLHKVPHKDLKKVQ